MFLLVFKGAASPKSGGHEFGSVSQTERFPTVYGLPMLSYIGMSYTIGKLRTSPLQWAGGHDRVFVSMVAAPMDKFSVSETRQARLESFPWIPCRERAPR